MKEHWEREKRQLLGEKAILQDTAHRLNMQVRSAQDEAKWSTENGKAAQKAKVSVQAVSPILSCPDVGHHLIFVRHDCRNWTRRSNLSQRWSQSSGQRDPSYDLYSPNRTGLNESARMFWSNCVALNRCVAFRSSNTEITRLTSPGYRIWTM